tara:strand:- start:258 stop:569 length:312 start_codon:yes stop_codon:yes gene_type:complete
MKGEALGREGTMGLIPVDLHRTFPWLNIFQKGGPYYDYLRDVLEAFVCYRPDIGYVQVHNYTWPFPSFWSSSESFAEFSILILNTVQCVIMLKDASLFFPHRF